jgi:multidrug efflux pump subunit AcrB
VGTSSFGAPVYLRDLVDIRSGYQSSPRYLNYYTWRDAHGKWQRTRAVALAVPMRQGEQIGAFAQHVQEKLKETNRLLPSDLIVASTSDQPRQVKENLDLFALLALWVMGSPFGFMAFLGIASLIGVIVSQVIVLFDFIEEIR